VLLLSDSQSVCRPRASDHVKPDFSEVANGVNVELSLEITQFPVSGFSISGKPEIETLQLTRNNNNENQ